MGARADGIRIASIYRSELRLRIDVTIGMAVGSVVNDMVVGYFKIIRMRSSKVLIPEQSMRDSSS